MTQTRKRTITINDRGAICIYSQPIVDYIFIWYIIISVYSWMQLTDSAFFVKRITYPTFTLGQMKL